MRKEWIRRAMSLILSISLMLGVLPTVRALKLEAERVNPNTGLVELNIDIDLTQKVSIEVLVKNVHISPYPIRCRYSSLMRLPGFCFFYCDIYKDCAR